MRKRLTRKQEKIARERVKDPLASHREIGYRTDTARPNVTRELSKPHVQARVRELMDSSPKLQVSALLAKLEEGLDAQEIKFFADKGKVISERVTVDYSTRLGYLDRALELQGLKSKDADKAAPVLSKDTFIEFCQAYWATQPGGDNRPEPKDIELR